METARHVVATEATEPVAAPQNNTCNQTSQKSKIETIAHRVAVIVAPGRQYPTRVRATGATKFELTIDSMQYRAVHAPRAKSTA